LRRWDQKIRLHLLTRLGLLVLLTLLDQQHLCRLLSLSFRSDQMILSIRSHPSDQSHRLNRLCRWRRLGQSRLFHPWILSIRLDQMNLSFRSHPSDQSRLFRRLYRLTRLIQSDQMILSRRLNRLIRWDQNIRLHQYYPWDLVYLLRRLGH
jgi:hypothetical protein